MHRRTRPAEVLVQHPFSAVSMGALGGASVCIPPPVITDCAALFGPQEQRQRQAHGGMGSEE